jgi:chromosome segregation ATPase
MSDASLDAQAESARGEIRRLGEESAHFRAQWRKEWERFRQGERQNRRLEADLEQARAEVERLNSERSRHASEALQEGRSAAAARAALREAQSEAHALRTERELLRERLVNAEANFAEAERRLKLLRSQLADVPANVDAIVVQQLREKLLDSSRKKKEYKRIARESIAHAGSLALQVRELEAELHQRLAEQGEPRELEGGTEQTKASSDPPSTCWHAQHVCAGAVPGFRSRGC